jgi:hypothetical protein
MKVLPWEVIAGREIRQTLQAMETLCAVKNHAPETFPEQLP